MREKIAEKRRVENENKKFSSDCNAARYGDRAFAHFVNYELWNAARRFANDDVHIASIVP